MLMIHVRTQRTHAVRTENMILIFLHDCKNNQFFGKDNIFIQLFSLPPPPPVAIPTNQSPKRPTNSKLINQLHRQISHGRGEDFLHTTRDAAAIEIIGDA